MGFVLSVRVAAGTQGECAAKQAASAKPLEADVGPKALEADVGPKPSSTCCDAGKMGWPLLRSRPGYLLPRCRDCAGRERDEARLKTSLHCLSRAGRRTLRLRNFSCFVVLGGSKGPGPNSSTTSADGVS